ncbi:MAG: ArdC-like ssDNA-binding domain-containing protein [Candidatus Aminicenantales bacterium]
MLGVQGASSEGKGSWKDRKRYMRDKLDELAAEIVTDPDKLKAFAERWRGGFRAYSLYNLALIWCQKHDATLCAGYHAWKRHGRHVKAGEKALWILAPAIVPVNGKREDETEDEMEKVVRYFFPVPVFDYGQTDGQGLMIGNTAVNGNGDVDLETIAAAFNVPVEYSQGIEDGHTDGKKIVISKRESKTQEAACFFHELAHVLLGHLENRKRGNGPGRDVEELEAESTAYLVGACLGIDNEGTKFYLGHWNGDRDKLRKSALRILSTSEKILRKAKPDAFGQRLAVQN